MKTTKTVYETGATSHAVNDLILFADNTATLAELRDKIYKRSFDPEDIVYAQFKVNGYYAGLVSLSSAFSELLRAAISQYKKEFPDYCEHVINIKQWDDEGEEFAALYAKDFDNWKAEHGYK